MVSALTAKLLTLPPTTSVCLLGDFNEVIGVDTYLIARLCSYLSLVDILVLLHLDFHLTPTYSHSHHHLDYSLVSSSLIPLVVSTGMNHFHEFFASDHHPIWARVTEGHCRFP